MANKSMNIIGAGQDTARPAPKKYKIIYADPPWAYNESGSGSRVVSAHYQTMQIEDICNMPISEICEENSILFIWTTFPRLFQANLVINSWGFKYKSLGFCWVKKNRDFSNFWGMGYYTRQNPEVCLIAVRGKYKPLVHNVHSVVESKIERHSKKPDAVRDLIVKVCGDVPRIELFARQRVEGWDAWGNEIPGSPVLCEESAQE